MNRLDIAAETENVLKYNHLSTKTFMTMEEATSLAGELARRLTQGTSQPELVVGIANGGLMPAWIVADTLKLPFKMIRIRRNASRLKRSLGQWPMAVKLGTQVLKVGPLRRWAAFHFNYGQNLEHSDGPASANVTGSRLKISGDDSMKASGGEDENSDYRNACVALVDDCIESGQTVELARSVILKRGANEVVTAVLAVSDRRDNAACVSRIAPVALHTRIHHYPWSQNSPFYGDFLAWLEERHISPWS